MFGKTCGIIADDVEHPEGIGRPAKMRGDPVMGLGQQLSNARGLSAHIGFSEGAAFNIIDDQNGIFRMAHDWRQAGGGGGGGGRAFAVPENMVRGHIRPKAGDKTASCILHKKGCRA